MAFTVEHHEQNPSQAHNAGTATLPDNIRAEYAALHQGGAFYEAANRAKLALIGGDRVRWLNGMVTNNIRDLAPGHGVYAFLLNPQGHILADLYAFNRGDSLLIDVDKLLTGKVQEIFERYIIMDDVEVADVTGKLLAAVTMGPGSRRILAAAAIQVPELKLLQFQDMTWQQIALTIVRTDNLECESFEIWLPPESMGTLRNALLAAGATPVGMQALELERIARGIPRYGQDIRERDLPQETSQDRALHFTKGCYVGQEIVERIRSRGSVHRQFSQFRVDGAVPAPGTKIQSAGKDVGEITSSAILPGSGGDHGMALGYIRKEAALPGNELIAGEAKLNIVRNS